MMERILNIYRIFVGFLDWWTTELKTLGPERIIRFFERSGSENTIHISATRIRIEYTDDGERKQQSFDGSLDTVVDNSELRQFLSDHIEGLCTVYLSEALYLKTNIELPRAASDEFQNAIRFQLGKLLPLPVDKMHYDSRITGRCDHPDFITVGLVMVKRSITDQIIDMIESCGLGIKSIRTQNENGASQFEFLNLERKYHTKNRMMIGGLVTSTIALLLFCGFALDYKYNAREDFLNTRIADLSAEAKRVSALEKQVDALVRQTRLVEIQGQKIRLDHIMETLTAAIPEDSWVYDLRQSGRKLTLVGISPNSSIILDSLARQPFFEDVSNNVTRGNEDGVEQFTLTMKLADNENISGEDDD